MMGFNTRLKKRFLGRITRALLVFGLTAALGLSIQITRCSSMPARIGSPVESRARAALATYSLRQQSPSVPSPSVYQAPYNRWGSRFVAPRFTGTTPGMLLRPSVAATQGATPGTLDPERQQLRDAGIAAEKERREKIAQSNFPEWLASAIYRPTQQEIDWKVLRTPAEEAQQNREALRAIREAGWRESAQAREERIRAVKNQRVTKEAQEELGLISQQERAEEMAKNAAIERREQIAAALMAKKEREKAIEQHPYLAWYYKRPTQKEKDLAATLSPQEAQRIRAESAREGWLRSKEERQARLDTGWASALARHNLEEEGLRLQQQKSDKALDAAKAEREQLREKAISDARNRQEIIQKSWLPDSLARMRYQPSQAEIDWQVVGDEE